MKILHSERREVVEPASVSCETGVSASAVALSVAEFMVLAGSDGVTGTKGVENCHCERREAIQLATPSKWIASLRSQ